LRDRFSVDSYRAWMITWREAGQFLRPIVKAGDRIFIYQAIAAAAFTDAHARDQFYAPPRLSRFDDLRSCADTAKCMALFDYILTFPGPQFRWPSHEELKVYSNLAILKRKVQPGSRSGAGGGEVSRTLDAPARCGRWRKPALGWRDGQGRGVRELCSAR
jgi:hypothetical protein